MVSHVQEKPAIYLRLSEDTDPRIWREVCLGMEEEGIPYQVESPNKHSITDDAHEAAELSPLAVGIACRGSHIILHSRNLAPDQPLFEVSQPDLPLTVLRNLGSNAARLVKGLPFKSLTTC